MQCPKCRYEPTMAEIQSSPNDCTKCGVNYAGHARHAEQLIAQREARQADDSNRAHASTEVRDASGKHFGPLPVVVVDIKMTFKSMVFFMVKWAIAAIPAALILLVIFVLPIMVVSSFIEYKSVMARLGSAPQAAGEDMSVPTGSGSEYKLLNSETLASGAIAADVQVKSTSGISFSRYFFNCQTRLGYSSPLQQSAEWLDARYSSMEMKEIQGQDMYYLARSVCKDW